MQAGDRLAEFAVESKLGEGSFSCVYKVRRIDDGQLYAMKKVKIGQMREKQRQNALNQVRILASISHPNIVNYRQAFFDDRTQTLCIVMELADAGDIQKKINIHLSQGTHFNQAQIWQALIQMARGLKALHDINILHRDLKCANVFCTSDRRYKLGDLNVSKVAKRGMARTQTGTPYYTSPEVWNDRPYDAKCDVWSLGCVVYEMVTLRPPFRANNLKQLYAKIQKGIYQPLPKFYSQDLRLIVGLCLKVLPTQRISAVDLLQHPLVIRNMASTQIQSQNNSQTSKCNLLKTIVVPKNLKSLKEALPGSKYDQPSKSEEVERKFKRANSANQLRLEIPQVISSPKVDGKSNEMIKYALMHHRPSQQIKRQMNSERQQPVSNRPIQRMQRNNSMEVLRKRAESNHSIDNSRRKDSSREIVPKELPRPISRQNKVPRPLNYEVNLQKQINVLKNRDQSSRILPRQDIQQRIAREGGSRERANSREGRSGSKNGAEGMQQISNHCRQIEQRVRLIIQRKKEQKQKQQRNPNLPIVRPSQKVQDFKYVYQRPSSRGREQRYISNKSIENKQQSSISSNRQGVDSKRSLQRPSSRDRVSSLQRGISRQNERKRYGLIKY